MQKLVDLLTQRFGFLITGNVSVNISETDRVLTVRVPEEIEPVTEKTTRKELESSGKWRWAAGGCAFVLALKDARVLVTIFRDADAPSYALHNTLSSGLSTCVEELLDPQLTAMREGYEEIQIFLQNGQRLVPELGQIARNDGVAYLPANIPTHDITPENSVWRVTVVDPDENENEFYALVNLDPTTGGIDVLKVIEMDLRLYRLDEIFIRDGELDGKLDRTIECFHLCAEGSIGEIVIAYKSGRQVNPELRDKYRFTTVLQEVVDALAN